MSTQLKLRRGTTAQHSTFTGASGEITVDTDKKTVVVHDGATAGGVSLVPSTDVSTSGGASKVLKTDSSGNLGLGVTPSAWSQGRAIEVENTGYGFWNGTYSIYSIANAYFNGGFKYANTGQQASHYYQFQGAHVWSTAPSGTAGNSISFTQAMTLDASSNLTINGSTATKASGTTWANPSDYRLKENVVAYAGGLSELLQVQVKTWEYNGKGGTTAGERGLGVIADEVMLVLPNSVDTYSAKLNGDDEEETDIKRFDATEITWLLVNSVKELTAKLVAAEARLAALEAA